LTDNAVVWFFAALQALAAVIVALYWVTWFREPHTQSWLPPGYVEHERAFVFTDSVLAVLLVTGAVLQVLERSVGNSLALVSAGMLTFLGIIDLAYFAREGMFRRDREGVPNALIVGAVLVLAVLLFARFA